MWDELLQYIKGTSKLQRIAGLDIENFTQLATLYGNGVDGSTLGPKTLQEAINAGLVKQ